MKTHLATRACASIGINGPVINKVDPGAQILVGQGHPSCITGMVSVPIPAWTATLADAISGPTQPNAETR